MDQLVGLSDDLGKLDTYVESITRKIAAYLREILEGQRDKVAENLLANNSKSKEFDPCFCVNWLMMMTIGWDWTLDVWDWD